MHSTFGQQVAALLQKCAIIKKKNKVETFSEFFIGIHQSGSVYSPVSPNYVVSNTMPLLGYVDLTGSNTTRSLFNYTDFPIDKMVSFTDESSMIDTYLDNPEKYWGGIIFNAIDVADNIINYTIRLNNTYSNNIQGSPYPYIEQNILSAFIKMKTGNSSLNLTLTTTEYPVPVNPYSKTIFNYLFPIYFPLFFMYTLQQLIILLVTEKKDGIKEGLKVSGMRESAYWTSNIIMQVVMNILLIVVVEILCYATKIFHYCSPIMIFISFFLYSLTLSSLGFLISAFLSNPKSGSALSALIVLLGIGLSCLYQFYLNTKVPSIKWLFYLFSPCAFGAFLSQLSFSENQNLAVSWTDPNFTESTAFLVIDFILYAVIAWYAIEVYPGEHGTGKPYLFFLQKDYWFQSSAPVYGKNVNGSSSEIRKINGSSSGHGIELRDLYKEYNSPTVKDQKVHAVNGLSLNIPQGTIFALLGHNGAGKSTTMNILCGMIPPTSGNAFINGLSVKNQMDFIRRSIGFCPQNNILYAQLTCAEHLRLFGKIKGVPANELESSISRSLQEVGLSEKKDTISSSLSGGMKRRLSLAMAFIGDPSIVFLDECTTGLDPMARHQVWELLQKKKVGKTIVMTTHFMEEAELLGESIGIMSKGKLRCMGTALELKALFGLGYIISFSIDRHVKSLQPFEDYFMSRFKDAVPGKQNSNIPKENGDFELSYSLSHQISENLSDFFQEVESRQEEFSVKRIGISMTTLEEVFLKIQSETHEHSDQSFEH
ncbi:ABC transporter A family protein [Heterostelium album PN500]|uniref:ABC transporter A family protein n=1 Tax=Heterostelium pallidum (strain ATCC 26659 / Pp 5 / PN500) TaxID=670386 RepID=D3BA89_HETP5|nr:ABC transporter A family protein [Heterostelium album PN500]EFA81476.1 ABC transporter A family protein [Heterostelium album PN500]|eukprot:XP_020433594.1 ABC transporter A family protein [Heterostelium album PN500]